MDKYNSAWESGTSHSEAFSGQVEVQPKRVQQPAQNTQAMEDLRRKREALLAQKRAKEKQLEMLLAKQKQAAGSVVGVGQGAGTGANSVPEQVPPPKVIKRGRSKKNPRPKGTDGETGKQSSTDEDETHSKRSRCSWATDELVQLYLILKGGKADAQSIFAAMSLLPGNTKSFENIRNKRSNLLQKATQRGHTLYDVLRDEITKAGGLGALEQAQSHISRKQVTRPVEDEIDVLPPPKRQKLSEPSASEFPSTIPVTGVDPGKLALEKRAIQSAIDGILTETDKQFKELATERIHNHKLLLQQQHKIADLQDFVENKIDTLQSSLNTLLQQCGVQQIAIRPRSHAPPRISTRVQDDTSYSEYETHTNSLDSASLEGESEHEVDVEIDIEKPVPENRPKQQPNPPPIVPPTQTHTFQRQAPTNPVAPQKNPQSTSFPRKIGSIIPEFLQKPGPQPSIIVSNHETVDLMDDEDDANDISEVDEINVSNH